MSVIDFGELCDIELMRPGQWQGVDFTRADLERIADNWRTLRDYHHVPIKLGHSEVQLLPGQTDGDPSLGWLAGLRVEDRPGGDARLVADFSDVPTELITAINARRYRSVSVELYLDWARTEAARNSHLSVTGPALSAVAVLGADIPAIRGLADLPRLAASATKDEVTTVNFSTQDLGAAEDPSVIGRRTSAAPETFTAFDPSVAALVGVQAHTVMAEVERVLGELSLARGDEGNRRRALALVSRVRPDLVDGLSDADRERIVTGFARSPSDMAGARLSESGGDWNVADPAFLHEAMQRSRARADAPEPQTFSAAMELIATERGWRLEDPGRFREAALLAVERYPGRDWSRPPDPPRSAPPTASERLELRLAEIAATQELDLATGDGRSAALAIVNREDRDLFTEATMPQLHWRPQAQAKWGATVWRFAEEEAQHRGINVRGLTPQMRDDLAREVIRRKAITLGEAQSFDAALEVLRLSEGVQGELPYDRVRTFCDRIAKERPDLLHVSDQAMLARRATAERERLTEAGRVQYLAERGPQAEASFARALQAECRRRGIRHLGPNDSATDAERLEFKEALDRVLYDNKELVRDIERAKSGRRR